MVLILLVQVTHFAYIVSLEHKIYKHQACEILYHWVVF